MLDKLITKAEAIKCGDPLAEGVDQGPQCNEVQFNKIMEYIEIGKTEAKLVAGGYADTEGDNANGFFIRPTIFSRCGSECPYRPGRDLWPGTELHPFQHH